MNPSFFLSDQFKLSYCDLTPKSEPELRLRYLSMERTVELDFWSWPLSSSVGGPDLYFTLARSSDSVGEYPT